MEKSRPQEALSAEEAQVKRLFCYDGVPMVEVILSIPQFAGEGSGELNRLYRLMEERCIAYAEQTLMALSCGRYEQDVRPQRRFLHRRLVFRQRLRLEKRGAYLSLARELSLAYRGRTVWRRCMGEVVDEAGCFCPARMFPHEKHRPAAAARDGFLLDRQGKTVSPESAWQGTNF